MTKTGPTEVDFACWSPAPKAVNPPLTTTGFAAVAPTVNVPISITLINIPLLSLQNRLAGRSVKKPQLQEFLFCTHPNVAEELTQA